MRGLSIPACPATFLIVIFSGEGDSHVDDKPYVFFVDTHSEANRCDDDLDFFVHEALKVATALLFGEFGVEKTAIESEF